MLKRHLKILDLSVNYWLYLIIQGMLVQEVVVWALIWLIERQKALRLKLVALYKIQNVKIKIRGKV